MTLATSILSPEGAEASRWALFLHGILGSRSNFRSIARAFVNARSGFGAVLVDLRMHGESQALAGPHTLEAAAWDLIEVARTLDGRLTAVVGHSFGGKVALELARLAPEGIEELWVLDSNPGARPDGRGSESTQRVVTELGSLKRRWASRDAFVDHLAAAGYDRGLGQWLAMNLERIDDGEYELRLDLAAIASLLDDYFARDLWPVFEDPPGTMHAHLVIGTRSTVLDANDRARAEHAASQNDRVHVHTIDAGHWIHVEASDALIRLLTAPPRP